MKSFPQCRFPRLKSHIYFLFLSYCHLKRGLKFIQRGSKLISHECITFPLHCPLNCLTDLISHFQTEQSSHYGEKLWQGLPLPTETVETLPIAYPPVTTSRSNVFNFRVCLKSVLSTPQNSETAALLKGAKSCPGLLAWQQRTNNIIILRNFSTFQFDLSPR